MMELPEIEQYRAALADHAVGELFSAMNIKGVSLCNVDAGQLETFAFNKTVLYVERRGKQLLLHLDNGKRLLLKLTSQSELTIDEADIYSDNHSQTQLLFGNKAVTITGLRALDIQLLSIKEVEQQLADSGLDPLDKKLTLTRFVKLFAKKRGALKTALSDHHTISGVGAVYADEIAYAAGIRSDTKIPLLTEEQWERLYQSMHNVLKEAITLGGMNAAAAACNKREAAYGAQLQVYGREGQACYKCGALVEKAEFASNKKAFICPSCQS